LTSAPLTEEQEKSFITLVKEHQGLIHKVCILYETDRELRNDSKITTWMYRIALNTAISGLRKLGRKIKTEELDEFHFNISENADDHREDDLQKLQWAIRQLTEIERAMIMMALDEVPYDEIAETIGITQNNVRVRMNRIREKLRKLMS
jgi:RNA polymerase sigma-70 factor (ECF subfamily)